MLRKLLLSTFLLLICVAGAMAQEQVGRNIADHLLIKVANKDLHRESGKETIGHPYLNDQFVNGVVYSFNRTFTNVPLRYNIYHDYIEFKQNNETYILDPEPRIKKVIFDNKYFVVLKFEYKGKAQHGYLELLDSGKVMLLAKKTVLYREWQEAKALESAATPAKYTRAGDIYFYKIGDGEPQMLRNLKKVIEIFPDKQSELAAFAKTEKLDLKSEDGLKKLFQYYNSL